MRRANGPRRTLPATVKFVLTILTLAALAYPFRLPPASRAESLDFYKTDGSDTARVLRETAGTLCRDIEGAGGVLHVDARVEAPELDSVPVLRASQGNLDARAVMSALGLNADTAEVAEDSIEMVTYLGYDVVFRLLWCDNGSLDITEAGKVLLYRYEPGQVYTAEEIVAMLRAGGLLAGDAQALSLDEGATVLVRHVYGQLPVSNTFSFDEFTGDPNYGAAFVVEQDMDGSLLYVGGRALGEAEVIWESARVIPPEDALSALAEYCVRDETVERIALAYHVRAIYGDPFHVVLYPVWEIYTGSSGVLNASIVNAITGNVEQSLLGEGEVSA